MVAYEGRYDRDPMCGGDFQYYGGRQGRMHREKGDVQIFGAGDGTVGRRMPVSAPEYQKCEASLGQFMRDTREVGGGDFCLSKVLSSSSAGGVTIWDRDLGVVGGNYQKVGGCPRWFFWKLTGKTASQQWVGIWSRAAAGIFLKKRGPRHLVRT